MLKAIFFDLDGTLLPLNEEEFTKYYFSLLTKKAKPYGYDSEKLIDTIWKGTYLMYQNDGKKTNEEVFWDYFASVFGKESLNDKVIFDDFYVNEFKGAKACCKENPLAKKIVSFCYENHLLPFLTTNPIFPRAGQSTRMSFLGLKEEDFKYVSYYENSSYCKPNPMYFLDILNKFNLKPEEVIVFGNNTYEDGECALKANIQCYLVKGFIIYSPKAKNTFEEITMEEIIPTILKHLG